MEFPETKEKHPGKPLVPLPITDITKLSPGDHVLYRIGEAGYRYDFRSGMVSDIDLREETLGIITLTAKGCKEEKFRFIAFPHLHRVEYSPCRFPAKDAISRARRRRDMNDQLYSPLNNNGHHFVTNAKTGQEYSLSDMILDLKRHRSEGIMPCKCIVLYLVISLLIIIIFYFNFNFIVFLLLLCCYCLVIFINTIYHCGWCCLFPFQTNFYVIIMSNFHRAS